MWHRRTRAPAQAGAALVSEPERCHHAEVFWIAEPLYIAVAVLGAVAVFFTAHLVESRYRWLTWLDAFALAVAVPAGVSFAIATQQSAPVIIIMEMVTGCLGGLMRDVVCNEVPLVLKQGELYASAAFAGAGTAVGTVAAGLGEGVAIVICGAVTLALLAGSIILGWRLPVYKARPPGRWADPVPAQA